MKSVKFQVLTYDRSSCCEILPDVLFLGGRPCGVGRPAAKPQLDVFPLALPGSVSKSAVVPSLTSFEVPNLPF